MWNKTVTDASNTELIKHTKFDDVELEGLFVLFVFGVNQTWHLDFKSVTA